MSGRSIARGLLGWTLAALALGAAALVWAAYAFILEELDEVFDENLKQVALAVAAHHGGSARPRAALPALPNAFDQPGDFDHVIAVWGRDGRLRYLSDPTATPPFADRTGLARGERDGRRWAVYTLVRDDDVVQVAQRETSRTTLAAEVAGQIALPLLAVVLATAALVVVALRRGLAPLDRAAVEVAARSAASLQPLDSEGLPREIHPMIAAINTLMARLDQALAAQRRFVADAAHELRSPLTALRLQLPRLERAADPAARAAAAAELRGGLDRMQRLVEQLLRLSRLEPDAPLQPLQPLALGPRVREAVARHAAEASHRGIDLGAEEDASLVDPVVLADAEQLDVLLDNLVRNALRHTPAGGRIDVRAGRHGSRPALQVIDSGPGIPEDERERVFDRFHRGAALQADERAQGSGLGLAIVRAIAGRCGAAVSLHTAPSGQGLEARVVFPEPPAAAR